MCILADIAGEGPVLIIQILTLAAIATSILLWAWLYRKAGLGKELAACALPIALWAFFGSLDILITAKGTFVDPHREGNQAARFIFVETGFFGPIVASVLWIALWAGLVFALNRLKMPLAPFISLAIFYSLALGHLSGFSSWYLPLCQIAKGIAWSKLPIIIGGGTLAAAAHTLIARRMGGIL